MKNILLVCVIFTSISSCHNKVKSTDSHTDSAVIKGEQPDTAEKSKSIIDTIATDTKKHGKKGKRNAALTTCTPNPDSSILQMHVTGQEERNWCWAACGQMLMDKSQCNQANNRFNMDTCCRSPRPTCDRTGMPNFAHYDFAADSVFCEALSWEEIKKQIDCKHKAFCWVWRYTSDGCLGTNRIPDTSGHLVVISGYKIADGDSSLKILDPLPIITGATYLISYSDYICGSYYAQWKNYYNIRKR